jgi:type I restriction enzyme S subunit
MVAQMGIDATCNQSMAAILPDRDVEARYLFWLLTAQYRQIRGMAGDELRDGLNLEIIGSIPTLLPPVEEQRAIAAFLDTETAKIDTLIEKKQALIEKLKEQRTALISRTVTRGLPPDAARAAGLDPHPRLKPSGIEWLGDLPEHWGVKPLSRVVSRIQTGPFGTVLHQSDYVEGGIPLVNPSHLVAEAIVPTQEDAVSEETALRLSDYRLIPSDIVFARRGEIGRCAVVGDAEAGWLCGTGSMFVRFSDAEVRYFAYVFGSRGFSSLLELHAVGTTMLNLSPAILGRSWVPAPPLPEQQAIADFLDESRAETDFLAAEIGQAIERLNEYRSALITTAVTGKIDVRHGAS